MQLLERVGLSATRQQGRNGVCPENHLLGGTSMNEASERLCAFLYLPQTWCAWDVRVHSPANFKLDQLVTRGALGSGWGIR